MQLKNTFNNFKIFKIEVENIATIYISCHEDSIKINTNVTESPLTDLDLKDLTFSLNNNFAYGGTRLAKFITNKIEANNRAIESVQFLAISESHIKQSIINQAIKDGALDKLIDNETETVRTNLLPDNDQQKPIEKGFKLPKDYLSLQVNGGRCIILPCTREIEEIMKDSNHPSFKDVSNKIFKKIAGFINGYNTAELINLNHSQYKKPIKIEKGCINLTPDFGRYAGIADILNEFSPQVLCVNPLVGGCGGKVSYTVTGIIEGIKTCIAEQLANFDPFVTSITFIGSAGALGTVIVEYLKKLNFKNVRICDLLYNSRKIISIDNEDSLKSLKIKSYSIKNKAEFSIVCNNNKIIDITKSDKLIEMDNGVYQAVPKIWEIIPAISGKYSDLALNESEIIISTTVGREIENSNYEIISKGTLFIAAHNISLPLGKRGIYIANYLHSKGVWLIPGQPLTLGGALTSRLEACYRSENKITKSDEGKYEPNFPKKLAHEIVSNIVSHLIQYIIRTSIKDNISPWETLLNYSNLNDLKSYSNDITVDSLTNFIPYDLRY